MTRRNTTRAVDAHADAVFSFLSNTDHATTAEIIAGTGLTRWQVRTAVSVIRHTTADHHRTLIHNPGRAGGYELCTVVLGDVARNLAELAELNRILAWHFRRLRSQNTSLAVLGDAAPAELRETVAQLWAQAKQHELDLAARRLVLVNERP